MDLRGRTIVDNAKSTFSDRLAAICSKSAFSHFLVCRYPACGNTPLEENLIVTNWPSALYRSYAQVDIRADRDFFGHFKSSISVLRDVYVHFPPEMADAETNHFASSIAYSLFTAARQQYVFVMSSRKQGINEHVIGATIVDTMDWLSSLPETPQPLLDMSERETECLYWAAAGKSSEDIALILSLSSHTVNDYLKSAIRKLKSINRTQAVAKATKLGVI